MALSLTDRHFLDTCQVENRFVSEKEGKAGTYPYLKKGVWKEYAWREPRFYASVAFNGCVWPLLNNSTLKDPKPVEQQVFYYRGNGNGYTNSNFLASHWYWNHEICSSGRYLCGKR